MIVAVVVVVGEWLLGSGGWRVEGGGVRMEVRTQVRVRQLSDVQQSVCSRVHLVVLWLWFERSEDGSETASAGAAFDRCATSISVFAVYGWWSANTWIVPVTCP